MNKRIEMKIRKLYTNVFKKIINASTVKSVISGNKKTISEKVLKLEQSKVYDRFAREFAKELAKHGLANEKGVWRQYFKAAKQIGIIAIDYTYKQYEKDIFEKAVKNNFKMIKSMPKEVMKVFEQKGVKELMKQVVEGSAPRNAFFNALKQHGAKKAGVIARTETAKLQSVVTEYRARNLNSVAYFWRSSNDRRTRQSHREMNNVVVFWRQDSEKPLRDGMRGNAGEFPNCRCSIGPIFDERDIKKPSYKVYDYRTDTIITMPRQMLLECLKNGKLD